MPSDRRSSSAGSGHSSRSRAERASGTMGPDGGEAGRRLAAEDEYIRQELTETTAFCNAFWGENDSGFDAISARMKASQRTLEDLKTLYKERADIEAEYARRLAKLSKQALGYQETGALKSAFDVVKIELEATSRSHQDLSNMLKKDLEGAVAEFSNRSWSARKAAQANIEKLHKNKQTQEQYVHKSRERYEQDCIKINGYTAQSSLVQGKDLDKVAYKLDKAQATVSQNDRDYQNFVRALKDTTVKWNTEWKAYLDQCQDQEEERIDFTKSNLWNFANAVSAVCVADDESCERIRVSLENVETPRDIHYFIQYCGTGSLIPAPPEYINYAKGQAPPARPIYHTANFQRNTTRPTQLPVPQQPIVLPTQQQSLPHNSQQQHSPQAPLAPAQARQPSQPHTNAVQGNPLSTKPIPPEPDEGHTAQQGYIGSQSANDSSHSLSKLPPGAVALPGMPTSSGFAGPVSPMPTYQAEPSSTTPSKPQAQRRMSTKNFLARTSSLTQNKPQSPRVAPVAPLGGGPAPGNPPAAEQGSNEEDPIAKALASLRLRPGGRSPGPARRESLTAEAQPPPFAQPGQIVQNMPPQHAYSPSSSAAQNLPPRARSPSAAFMQAPARAASPLPVEDVVGQYGQSFPGERKSLSRQNSVASHAGVQSPSSRPKSPMKQEQGFAGVGARGRSPSPQPWTRPTQQQQQQQQQHATPMSTDQPRTGTLSRRQSQVPPRSTTPLGISLDATGSVTHDQMAVDYMRRAGSVPPQQQQIVPPGHSIPPAQAQVQPPRPASVVHTNYAQSPNHQPQASVSSHYSQAIPTQGQSPYPYQNTPSKSHQPYPSQHVGQPSMYSTTGQIPSQSSTPAPGQFGAYSGPVYSQSPHPQQPQHPQPPTASQSMPAHMVQQQPHLSQYSTAPAPIQSPYQQQPPQLAQQAQHQQPQQAYYGHPAPTTSSALQQQTIAHHQETPASAYMQEYLQQQQQAQQHGIPMPNGSGHAHQPSSMSLHQQQPTHSQSQHHLAQQQPQQQPPPSHGSSQPQGHAPTGQYSDSGQPILFYVKALYDYQATNPDEFSFTTGDIIAVIHTEADGWWQGELLDEARRKPGANTFPSNFVSLLM